MRKSKAFTLIETLVALALFGTAIIVLTQSYLNAIYFSNLDKNDQTETDAYYCYALDTILKTEKKETFDEGGEILLPYSKQISWKTKLNPQTITDLFQVEITLQLEEESSNFGNRELSKRHYSFLLLRKKWSDPIQRTIHLEERKRVS